MILNADCYRSVKATQLVDLGKTLTDKAVIMDELAPRGRKPLEKGVAPRRIGRVSKAAWSRSCMPFAMALL